MAACLLPFKEKQVCSGQTSGHEATAHAYSFQQNMHCIRSRFLHAFLLFLLLYKTCSVGREPTPMRPALSHTSVPKKPWAAGLGPTQQPRQLQPRSPTTHANGQTSNSPPHTTHTHTRAHAKGVHRPGTPSQGLLQACMIYCNY